MTRLDLQQIAARLEDDKQFVKMDVSGLFLREMNFSGANFSDAKLAGVDFQRSMLTGCNFSNADLTHVDLRQTDLSGANFSSANLAAARFDATPRLHGAILPDGRLYHAGIDLVDYTGPADAIHATVFLRPADQTLILKAGTPDLFQLSATTVQWMSRAGNEIMLHICNIYLDDDHLAEIAQRALDADFTDESAG